jgi:hypothetical protein
MPDPDKIAAAPLINPSQQDVRLFWPEIKRTYRPTSANRISQNHQKNFAKQIESFNNK